MTVIRRSSSRSRCIYRSAVVSLLLPLAALAGTSLLGCGSDDSAPGSSSSAGSAGSSGSPATGGSAGGFIIDAGGGSGGGVGGGNPGPYVLPPDFTKTEFGGYKLGEPFNGDAPPGSAGSGGSGNQGACGTTILGVVRDFKGINEPGGHPDFEAYQGKGATLDMVSADIGPSSKPSYTGVCEAANAGNRTTCRYGQQTTSLADFSQWYNYAADINKPYVVYLSLEPNVDVYTFQSDFFFPLDNAGWGNFGKAQDKKEHNFNFTTEVHTEFKYNGGEKFTFIGDDDVWVFINNKLAVDLGGLHPQETGTILLDQRAAELGLSVGNIYPLDLFHAERHTNASHFRVDSNLQFTDCGKIVPDVPK